VYVSVRSVATGWRGGRALGLAGLLTLSAQSALAAEGLPPGQSNCYVYLPNATYLGAVLLQADGTDRVMSQEVEGAYQFDAATGPVTWKDKPPLGFEVAILEASPTAAKLRMYRTAADAGKKWKATMCSLEKEKP
jgi:hypothetical protein